MACDANALLMLHCDGADASTTFTDSSTFGRTITTVGNAQISTAQSVFGGASFLGDGAGDWVTAPDSGDWDFGTGDFTFEFRVRFAASGNYAFFEKSYTGAGFLFEVSFAGTALRYWSSGGILKSVTWSPSTLTWYGIAFVRTSGTFKVFIDGVQTGTDFADTTNITGTAGVVSVCGNATDSSASLNGNMDEIRISNNARYTSNYTLATSAFCGSTANTSNFLAFMGA